MDTFVKIFWGFPFTYCNPSSIPKTVNVIIMMSILIQTVTPCPVGGVFHSVTGTAGYQADTRGPHIPKRGLGWAAEVGWSWLSWGTPSSLTKVLQLVSLVPDGRIQGRWTQKWPSKISCGLGSQRPRKRPNSKFPNCGLILTINGKNWHFFWWFGGWPACGLIFLLQRPNFFGWTGPGVLAGSGSSDW